MKSERTDTVRFNVRCFAGAAALTCGAFGLALLGSHAMWLGGWGDKAQALLCVALLTLLPLLAAVSMAIIAVRSSARRAVCVSACLGFLIAGIASTAVMLSNANRRGAVMNALTSSWSDEEVERHVR